MNNVKFQIKILVDGKEHVVQTDQSVKELIKSLSQAGGDAQHATDKLMTLDDALSDAHDGTERLNTSLLNLNQVAEVFNNLQSTIQQVQGVVQELTGAYAVQERAEAQLSTIMKQRMGANAEEVESIKRLASAQQDLGVIGDEVQLMGAQQVATFLSEKDSIETLLPALNDLLAQQKGLNATAEDAVSIGNLLGKAMQGQTSVLTRVGITFSEAQEQVMKYGTESQRAAMLAQVITDNVGHMNAELAKTDTGKQKQLENALGDIKEQFGQLVQPATRAITVIASTTTAVSGVAKLTTSLRSLHVMMQTATASSVALKWSIRGLEIATGIGVVLAALSIAVEVFGRKADKAADAADDLADSVDGVATAMQREESQVNASRAALEMNIERLRNFNGTKADEKKLVEEMNGVYGETMGYFDSVSKWYEALTKNSEAYCRQLVVEAKMRALANQVAEKEAEMDSKRRARREMLESGDLNTTRSRVAEMGVDKFGNTVVTGWKEGASEAEEYINKIDEELIDGTLEVNRMKNEMRDLAAEAAKVVMPVHGSPMRPSGGGDGGTAGSVPGGVSGLSAMSGAGMGSYSIEMKAVGVDQVMTQMEALGESLSGPIERMQRLTELLAQVAAEGGVTGETMSELDSIMSGMTPEQSANAIAAMATAQESAAKAADKQAKKLQTAKESVAQFGGAMASLGDALEVPALNVAGTIMQAIANVALSYASAAAQASEMGPWVWLGFAAAGLAEMVAVIASIKNATAFADGGVVSGPTYALIGEYAGASNNPEVVAPLSKLQDMIEPGTVQLPERIEIVADGRELRAVLIKEGNIYKRG